MFNKVLTYLLTYLRTDLTVSCVQISTICFAMTRQLRTWHLWRTWSHSCSLQSRRTRNLQCHFINSPAFSYWPIAVSSAGCERAFSKLSLVKGELRSTMTGERLSG